MVQLVQHILCFHTNTQPTLYETKIILDVAQCDSFNVFSNRNVFVDAKQITLFLILNAIPDALQYYQIINFY